MEIRQLYQFLRISETLNFTKASKQLHMTVSALSQSTKQLEEELGVVLFDRNSHEVFLTEAGQELVIYAQETLRAADDCKTRMADFAGLKFGTLRIGVTHSFSRLSTKVLLEFSRLYPNIRIELNYETQDELMEMLYAHKLDFVLSYNSRHPNDRVESTMIINDRLGVIAPEDHELCKRNSISIEELGEYSFALPGKGLQVRAVLDELLIKNRTTLNTTVEANIITPLIRLVEKGPLLSILSCTSVIEKNNLRAIPLDNPGSDLQGALQILKGSYRKKSVTEMQKLILKFSKCDDAVR